MKTIIAIFKNVINPVSVMLITLIGLLAAFLSGVIEFFVLKDWFSTVIVEGKEITLTFFPLVIVVVLEGSKFFLHFGSSSIKQNSKEQFNTHAGFVKIMNAIKCCLIVFSFVCTMIFTCNFLYHESSLTISNDTNTKIEAVNIEYNKKVENYKTEHKNNIKSNLDTLYSAWMEAESELEKLTPVFTPRVAYERYIEEKKRLEIIRDEKRDEYKSAQSSLDADESKDIDLQAGLATIEKEREEEIQKIKQETIHITDGDNEYIRTFLLFLFNSFAGINTYPKILYFVICILISFVIAGVLEAVIYTSQRLITIPANELEEIFEREFNVEIEIKSKIEFLTRIIINAVISFFIFIVYGLIKEISMNKFNVIAAVVCCITTVVVSFAIPKIQNNTPAKTPKNIFDKGINLLKNFWVEEGKIMLIKGMLAFVLFLILGVIFEKDIANISIPAIGVAIGGSIGHIFNVIPIPTPIKTS